MNSFGQLFRISIFGESHGSGIGVTIDGTPPGIDFSPEDMIPDLKRRMPTAKGTTPRREADRPEILSGVYKGKTTGAPITILFRNENTRSSDYDSLRKFPRPGHADFTAMKKYGGYNDPRGGGHFSGRITLGIVAAGALAKKITEGVDISSKIIEIGGKKEYEDVIDRIVEEHDSAGGIVEVKISGVLPGLGEPFFNSYESCMSHLVFSIPAVKGIEFGAGFAAARMKGSEHNDAITDIDGRTATNRAGGINGGISNGNEVVFRVAVKPTPSIGRAQKTLNIESGETEEMTIEGRHDACITLRTPVIFEACAAIVTADLYMMNSLYNQKEKKL